MIVLDVFIVGLFKNNDGIVYSTARTITGTVFVWAECAISRFKPVRLECPQDGPTRMTNHGQAARCTS
jgi:hypothetical protein